MTNPQVPVSGSVGSGGDFPTNGSTAITLAGAAYTLRLFAPTSEVCYQQIVATGVSAGSSVVAPLVAGFTFCVINNSDGPFEFGGASGATVSIPVSTDASGTWVTTDGTNYGEVGGGGGGAVLPLTRWRYVDGDATGVTSPNGAAVVGQTSGGPWSTVTDAMNAIGVSTSTDDANALFAVSVSPSKTGYTETVTSPSYRNLSLSGPTGGQNSPIISGGLVVNSVAGGGAVAGSSQTVTLEELEFTGPISLNADGTSPVVELGIGDNVTFFGVTGAWEIITGDGEWACLGAFNTPTSSCIFGRAWVFIDGALTCAGLVCNGVLQVIGDIDCAGEISIFSSLNAIPTCSGNVTANAASNLLQSCTFEAITYRNNDASGGTTFVGCAFLGTIFIDNDVTFEGCSLNSGGSLTGATVAIAYTTFGGGFNIVAATAITSDAASWTSYLAQGGTLPVGATLTIVGQTASGYTTSAAFPANAYAITPAVSPGTPVLAFNLECKQTGRVTLHGVLLVDLDTADIPTFAVFAQTGAAATGGTAAGPNALFGSDATPLTVPAITTTPIGVFGPPITVGVTGVQSMTLDCHVDNVPLGASLCVWVQAAGTTGANTWQFTANVECDERALN